MSITQISATRDTSSSLDVGARYAAVSCVLTSIPIVSVAVDTVTATGTAASGWQAMSRQIDISRYCGSRPQPVRSPSDAAPRQVVRTPGVCGGEARIAGTRIPVWVLEQARRLGASDREILQAYPTLGPEDLARAWSYVMAHLAEIERDIEENEEA